MVEGEGKGVMRERSRGEGVMREWSRGRGGSNEGVVEGRE